MGVLGPDKNARRGSVPERKRRGSVPDARQAALMAQQQMEAQEEASFIFHKYDLNKDNAIDEDELALCFSELAVKVNGRQRKTDEEVRDWVRREFVRNDLNKDGQLSFDEFVEYYNRFIGQSRRPFEETYKITEKLGKGAFATVKKALVLQPLSGMVDEVAVKCVQKAGVNMKLLHNEITIWSGLKHSHLVHLYDAFETPDELLLVTELMGGGDLFERLRRIASFDEATAQDLSTQIISAIAYLHLHGVVHCDLKPSNILVVEGLTPDADTAPAPLTVKVADFGLSQTLQRAGGRAGGHAGGRRSRGGSKSLPPGEGRADDIAGGAAGAADGRGGDSLQTALAMAGVQASARGTAREVEDDDACNLTDVCGTPEYFAPELVLLSQAGKSDGGGYDAKVDCWACGCIVFELLCGSPPFQAKSEDVLFYKILENCIDFPKEVFGAMSDDVRPLILGLTTTAVADRLSASAALRQPWLAAGLAAERGRCGAELPTRRDTRTDSAKWRQELLGFDDASAAEVAEVEQARASILDMQTDNALPVPPASEPGS